MAVPVRVWKAAGPSGVPADRARRSPARRRARPPSSERYDHLLAGWSVCVPRFAGRGAGRAGRVDPLLVVFLCRDRPRARECARLADHVLCACRAYAGEHPRDWEYPGRASIVFVSERDVHEGLLLAYGVPRLPPNVRGAPVQSDPRASQAAIVARGLLFGRGGGLESSGCVVLAVHRSAKVVGRLVGGCCTNLRRAHRSLSKDGFKKRQVVARARRALPSLGCKAPQ